jgi:hypothetical protein
LFGLGKPEKYKSVVILPHEKHQWNSCEHKESYVLRVEQAESAKERACIEVQGQGTQEEVSEERRNDKRYV